MIVLPPAGAEVPPAFKRVHKDKNLRYSLLASIQRFRGRVYLSDGAIQPHELTETGRHYQEADEKSWHVMTLDRNGGVCACLRFLESAPAQFEKLCLRHAALNWSDWGGALRKAVRLEIKRAGRERMRFGEVGGWAVAPERRAGIEPLRTILATYGLLQILGGCAGVATATYRHNSAGILRRIGLSPLAVNGTELPGYYDPQYRCEMEVLCFDSRLPNPRFRPWIEELGSYLADSPVFSDCAPSREDSEPESAGAPWRNAPGPLPMTAAPWAEGVAQ